MLREESDSQERNVYRAFKNKLECSKNLIMKESNADMNKKYLIGIEDIEAIDCEKALRFESLSTDEMNESMVAGGKIINGCVCKETAHEVIIYADGDILLKEGRRLFSRTHFTSINLRNVKLAYGVDSIDGMFEGCRNLRSVDFGNLDTSAVKSMWHVFANCKKLARANVEVLNTSSSTGFVMMFYNCESLEEVNVSNMKTGNVTCMGGMFAGCKRLKSVNVGGFNMISVGDCSYMFDGCESLESMDLSEWKCINLTDMQFMFAGCKNMKSLSLKGMLARGVRIHHMFDGCESLEELDISDFFKYPNYMDDIFKDCKNLKYVNMRGINSAKVEKNGIAKSPDVNDEDIDEVYWATCIMDFTGKKRDHCIESRSGRGEVYMFYGCESLENVDVSNYGLYEMLNAEIGDKVHMV